MKQRLKYLAFCGMLVCLLVILSGCYMEPDNITGSNITTGASSVPWQNAATAVPATTRAPTQAPTAGVITVTAAPTVQGQTTNGTGSIVLVTATPATGVVSGTAAPNAGTAGPTGTVSATATNSVYKLGSSGSVVRTIQSRLISLGYMKGSADGDFGEATEAAVKAFQSENGITADGVVGAQTFERLNSANAKTAKPTATPTPDPAKAVYKNGSTGTVVKEIQNKLISLGYLSSGNNTGYFGDLTEAAVKAFQSRNKLSADGIVGQTTLTKLNSSSAVHAAAAVTLTPKPTSTPSVSQNIYLQLGSSGNNVKTMQARLISLGYLSGTADGEFGAGTEAAVKAFQTRNGVWSDGIAGYDTLTKLYSSSAKSASGSVASVGEKYKLGDEGTGVRALQSRLITLGYLTGTADGSFGQATEAAVIDFQKNNGLTADGVAGTNTFNMLYSSNVKYKGQSSATATPRPAPTATPIPSSTGYTTLRQGDTGSAVTKLQQALKNLSYYSGSVDGSYGNGTVIAVKAFQTVNQIKVDGIAGPATQRLLYGDTGVNPGTYTGLRLYDEGTGVYNLQYTLYELNYYQGSLNSIYNVLTQSAVMEFQRNNGLTVDGIAGANTLAVLYSSYAKPAGATTNNYKKLQYGDTGNEVVEMQDALMQKGYLVSITGTYDTATVAAITTFQTKNGLNADGIAGEQTLTVLYSGSAK